MGMICPRCGARLSDTDSECRGCGRSTIFVEPDRDLVPAVAPVVEPEVLESLDEADRTRFAADPRAREVGCSLGPGCGCLGLPLAVLAGVVVSSLVALLWVLSLGRVPASLIKLAHRVRRGGPRG
jgi:hypothetical protein